MFKILREIKCCMIRFAFLLVFWGANANPISFSFCSQSRNFHQNSVKGKFCNFHTMIRVLTSISWFCLLTSCFERCFCLRVQLISLLHCWYYFCNVDKLNFRGSIRKNSYCVTLWQIKTLCNSLKTSAMYIGILIWWFST